MKAVNRPSTVMSHVTCATDTELMRKLFEKILISVHKESMKASGFYVEP